MSRKRFSNKRDNLIRSGYIWFCLALALALFFPSSSRPEGKGEVTLFAYSDVLQDKAIVDGGSDSVGKAPDDGAGGWADMVIDSATGEEVYISKKLDMDVGAKLLDFSLLVQGTNPAGGDYEPAKAKYPFFLQLVFEGAPRGISIKKKLSLWVKSMRSKKIERRHNIIYVFANRMPKESIVNPYPGGAIISIGDDRDVGRLIHITRDLKNDYKLAFGSKLESRLKKVVIGFEGMGDSERSSPVSVSRFLLKPSP